MISKLTRLFLNPLFIRILMVNTFLWFGVVFPVNAEKNKFNFPLSIKVDTKKRFYSTGERIFLQISIRNRSTYNLCLRGYENKMSKVSEGEYGIDLYLVRGSRAVQYVHKIKSDQNISIVTLGDQQTKKFSVDLEERFGVLEADRYVVFARYQSKKGNTQVNRMLNAQKCRGWSHSSRSEYVEIIIEAQDQPAEIRKWVSLWKGEKSIEKKRRALLWLKDNIIKAGMTDKAVKELLGDPNSFYSDGSWIYEAGSIGLQISFTEGRIERVYQFVE